MLETQQLRIIFEVWDPDLGCLVLETQHLRIIFEILDLHLGCLVLEPIFRENVSKTFIFHGLGAARNSEPDVPDVPDVPDEGKTVHDWHFGP